MITLRHSQDRGYGDHGWLKTYHSFSFGNYYDPNHLGFQSLRVINEDRVSPGAGFATHGHRDMEIITYVLAGALEHKDSLGNGSIIKPGEIQRMSAGRGILHSEYNASSTELVHFLQIWIVPNQTGLEPSYEQRPIGTDRPLQLLAAPADSKVGSVGRKEDAVKIHQDVLLYRGRMAAGDRLTYELMGGRCGWLQMTGGSLALNGVMMGVGDGAAIQASDRLEVESTDESEFLLFDLASA